MSIKNRCGSGSPLELEGLPEAKLKAKLVNVVLSCVLRVFTVDV